MKTFTAVVDHIEQEPDHLKLTGTTYLWMFLIWGVAFYVSALEAKAMEKRAWIFPVRSNVVDLFSPFRPSELTLHPASMACVHYDCLGV